MLKIAICDDNPTFLHQIHEYVLTWNKTVQIHSFNDGDALINMHSTSPFDVILLDVVMPLLNGIDVAKEIRTFDQGVKIVFITSSVEYAIDSYSVKADNYLLKPIDKQALWNCLDEISKEKFTNKKSIMVKSSTITHRIFLDDIEYIEAQNKNAIIHLVDGTYIKSNNHLYVFEEQLQTDDGFFKCSRSYIVNVYYVSSYTSKEVNMLSGERISISRKLYQEFENVYFSTFFNKAGDM